MKTIKLDQATLGRIIKEEISKMKENIGDPGVNPYDISYNTKVVDDIMNSDSMETLVSSVVNDWGQMQLEFSANDPDIVEETWPDEVGVAADELYEELKIELGKVIEETVKSLCDDFETKLHNGEFASNLT